MLLNRWAEQLIYVLMDCEKAFDIIQHGKHFNKAFAISYHVTIISVALFTGAPDVWQTSDCDWLCAKNICKRSNLIG